MPKCYDCGWLELTRYFGSCNGICREDLKKPRKISDPFVDTQCKKFVPKARGLSIPELHNWKDRHITNRRNFWISMTALIISIISLLTPIVILPIIASLQPEVVLTFEYFPEEVIGPANTTLQDSFTLYNRGSKICFIETIFVYEFFQNGTRHAWMPVDIQKLLLNPGETLDVPFILYYGPGGATTKKFQIIVFYGQGKYAESPIATAIWT